MPNKTKVIDKSELAHLGHGQIAYIKRMLTDEIALCFPTLPPMTPGVEIWALFGAGGEPLILSDTQSDILASVQEQSLKTVLIH